MTFNFTPSLLVELDLLRSIGTKSYDISKTLSLDESLYIQTEILIREDRYQDFQIIQPKFKSEFLRDLCTAYISLFSNPTEALKLSIHILSTYDIHYDLQIRVQYWIYDCYLLTGDIKNANDSLAKLVHPREVTQHWRGEAWAIYALDFYFLNRLDSALEAHLECERFLQAFPDRFLSVFNASMALRVTLKLSNPTYFDFFTKIISKNCEMNQEKRYSLRIYAYKALILQQLGQYKAAESEWTKGDIEVLDVQMVWERGQYYLLRGFGEKLLSRYDEAKAFFNLAETDLKTAGSPLPYIAELEIAKACKNWFQLHNLNKGLKPLFDEVSEAKLQLNTFLVNPELKPVSRYFEEAIQYCDEILQGKLAGTKTYHSLILSILQNYHSIDAFINEMDAFRLYPRLIEKLNDLTSYDEANVSELFDKELNFLAKGIHTENEYKKILDFSNTIKNLSAKIANTTSLESYAKVSRQVGHDLRAPLSHLSAELRTIDLSNEDKSSLQNSIDRIHGISSSLLNYGRTVYRVEEYDVVSEVKLMFAQLRVEFSNIQFEFEPSSTSKIESISKTNLSRIINNLIRNSIEANSLTIHLALTTTKNAVQVELKDSGKGISKQDLAKILIGGYSTKENGHGLGVAWVKDQIHSIGGEFSIVSTPGKGTIVRLALPIESLISKPTKMIHLDDDKYVRASWKLKAKEYGIEIQTHANSTEMLNSLNGIDADTPFFLDLNLNENLSGLDVAESLYNKGYKNLNLTTGEAETLQKPAYINRIFAKEFPFSAESPI